MKLDDIREAADRKYGSLDIEVGDKTVRLLNPLRLSEEKRTKLDALQSDIKEDGADHEAIMRDILRLTADTKANAELLLKAVGGDLALLSEIFSEYAKQTRVGEASA